MQDASSEKAEEAKERENIPIEELPLQKRLQLIESENPYQHLVPGNFVDALDSVNSWCMARILRIDSTQISVNFDGWTSRYDDVFRINSYKVCPFRQCSKGYTGQVRIPLRTMAFSLPQLEEQRKKLEEVISSKFSSLKNASEVTQYLRGELFVYVDFLMTEEYKSPSEEIPQIVDFLRQVVRLICLWINTLPDIIKSFLEWRKHPKLFLIDRNVALAASTYEIVEMLRWFFCHTPRTLVFFERYDMAVLPAEELFVKSFDIDFERKRNPKAYYDELLNRIEKEKEMIYGLFCTFFNDFCRFGGFSGVMGIISSKKETEKTAEAATKSYKFPIDVMAMLLSSFRTIKSIASEKIIDQLVEVGKLEYFNRIINLDEKEIREINKDILVVALKMMKGILLLKYSPEETSKIIQTHEMCLAVKFLRSDSLENRLNGMAEIKKLVESVDQTSVHNYIYQATEGWMNSDYMAKWLVENKVLDQVLNDNTHPELVRRTAPIFIFLSKKEVLTNEMLELLWKCQIDKHEDLVRVVYQTIQEITEFLPIDSIKFLFNFIENIPFSKYDEKLIEFMKNFTLNAFNAHFREKKFEGKETAVDDLSEKDDQKFALRKNEKGEIVMSPDKTLYCLPIFWGLLQDSSPASSKMTEQFVNATKELLSNSYCVEHRFLYLCLCIENLIKHQSVTQSLILCHTIILMSLKQTTIRSLSITEIITQLDSVYQLIDIIINSCEHYMEITNKVCSASQSEPISEKIIQGKYQHSINLEWRLKILELILRYGNLKIKKDSLQKLWDLFIIKCQSDYDAKYFLLWLANEKEIQGKIVPISQFSQDETMFLFEIICKAREKLCNKYDLVYYNCFSKHFRLINEMNDSIELKGFKAKVKNLEKVIGLDALWDNVFYSTQKDSVIKFIELLTDIYLFPSDFSNVSTTELTHTFIDRCLSSIEAKEENNIKIANIVKALLWFFNSCEGAKYIVKDEPENNFRSFKIVAVDGDTSKTVTLEVTIDITLGQLRKKIATAFNLPFNEFILFSKIRELKADDNDSQLRNVGWAQQVFIKRKSEGKSEDPKMYLSNHENFDNLFSLLSNENTLYVDTVWDLLSILPHKESLLNGLKKLEIPSEASPEAWNELLNYNSVHKFLYSLQIVEGLLNLQETKEKSWIEDFCAKGGLTHLFASLIKLPVVSINQPLARKCFGLLLQVLKQISQKSTAEFIKHIQEISEAKGMIIERILQIFLSFAKCSVKLQIETKTPKKVPYYSPSKGNKAPEIPAAQQKKMEEESKVFTNGFSLIKSILSKNYFEYLLKFENFQELLLKGLVQSDNTFLKASFATEISLIFSISNSEEYSDSHPQVVLLPFFLTKVINETIIEKDKSKEFYTMLGNIIKQIPKEKLKLLKINFHNILKDLAEYIISRPIKEALSTDCDQVQVGLLEIMEILLSKFPEEKLFVGQTCKIMEEIIHRGLFEFPKKGKVNKDSSELPPKFKSTASKHAAHNLLCTICRDSPLNLTQILEFLRPIHASGSWRTKRIYDWHIVPETTEKSTTGFVGIRNLGCICYMNSLLQQFYMIPSFRNDILSVVDPNEKTAPDENMLFQLQCLFAALNLSMKQYYNPKIFCNSFKDWDGRPINVLEQMDADEFFNMFLDKVEFAIKNTPQKGTIKYNFGGLFANQVIGKDCPHTSARKEPFLAVNLQVKNKKSLEQALESFVEGEMLQGSNAYQCEKCDKKVSALKRVCIKRLPRYLIFVLKRFDIDYNTMQKFKINDYCEFPMRLDMEPYTEEGLARKDREQEIEKAKNEGKDELDLPKENLEQKYPREYYDYKLTGVTLHIGNADAGHYYSLIMDREKTWKPESERWYEFNDTFVDEYNLEDLKNDAFGGEERSKYEGFSMHASEKIRNAYLLVYERVTPYDPPLDEEEEDYVTEHKVGVLKEPTLSENIKTAVLAENIKYWHSKLMFIPEYCDFALKLCLSWNSAENVLEKYPSKNMDYELLGLSTEVFKSHAFQSKKYKLEIMPEDKLPLSDEEANDMDFQVFKYASTLLLTTLFRNRNRYLIPDFIDIVKAYINKSVKSASWLLQQFTNSKIMFEFLLECLVKDMRRFTAGILYCAMLKVYESEKDIIREINEKPEECTKVSILLEFANCWFNQLSGCRKFTMNFEHFFQIFAKLTVLGPEIRQYFLRTGALTRLFGFMNNLGETNWNDFSAIKYSEISKPELGLPSNVDERFQSSFEEYFAIQRDKSQENALPFYTFLFEGISNLLRSTTVHEKLSPSVYALPCCIPGFGMDEMIVKILTDKKILFKLIDECRNEISSMFLKKCMLHLCYENPLYKNLVISVIFDKMNEYEWNNLKKTFLLLKYIIQIEDSGKEATLKNALSQIEVMLETNKNYYYSTYYGILYIVSLATDIEEVRNYLATNPSLYVWMKKWLFENPSPSYSLTSTLKLFKSPEENSKMMNRYFDSEFVAHFKDSSEKIITNIKLLEDKIVPSSSDLTDEKTTYINKFFVNQTLELKDTTRNTWSKVVVLTVLDEMINAKPEEMSEKYAEWIETDGDILALSGTHIKGAITYNQLSSSDDDDSNYLMNDDI